MVNVLLKFRVIFLSCCWVWFVNVLVLLCFLMCFCCFWFWVVKVFVFWIMWLIFFLLRMEVFWIVMFCFWLVVLFFVVICKILLVLMLKEICIWGIFLGVGGILFSLKWLREILLLAIFCFFWSMWIFIMVWLFFLVEKMFDLCIGMVVLWGSNFFIMLLMVFNLKERGVIFSSKIFFIFLFKMFVWIVVSIVIILLGLMFLLGFWLMKLWIRLLIMGIWVLFFISIILLICIGFKFVFFSICLMGFCRWVIKFLYKFLNFEWFNWVFKCLGLFFVVVMKGKLIFVVLILESLILVFFVVLVNFCRAWWFCCKFIFFVFKNFFVS